MAPQTAEQEGRDLEDLFLPITSSVRTFKDSLYGQDPPMYLEVKGRGKVENLGWQDPEVVRALQNKPLPRSLCMEEACRKQFGGGAEMIHTTRKKSAPVGTPKNPAVQVALQSAKKAQKARKEIKEHKPFSQMKWMKEICEHQHTVRLLIPKLPFQRLV